MFILIMHIYTTFNFPTWYELYSYLVPILILMLIRTIFMAIFILTNSKNIISRPHPRETVHVHKQQAINSGKGDGPHVEPLVEVDVRDSDHLDCVVRVFGR